MRKEAEYMGMWGFLGAGLCIVCGGMLAGLNRWEGRSGEKRNVHR